MEIFWRLILGHLVADFTLQTNYIAAWKRRNLWGLLAHCAIHPIVYALLLWNYLGRVWVEAGPFRLTGCACVLLIFLAHLAEDQWRIWSVTAHNAPDNTVFYLWDQVIHYSIIFAFSPVIDGTKTALGFLSFPAVAGVVSAAEASSFGLWQRFLTVVQPEPWVFAAILLVAVTHFTTVTVYFIEKDLYGADFPETKEKYLGMAERAVLTAGFLLPGLWWTGAAGVWLARAVVLKLKRSYDASWLYIFLSNGAAVFCGLLARRLIYP